MERATQTTSVESIGDLTKALTSGQMTQLSGPIRTVTGTETTEPSVQPILISSRTTLPQRMTTIAMVILIDGPHRTMDPTVKDSSSMDALACMEHRSTQLRAAQIVMTTVGPIRTMISHSTLHNSSITMEMDLVIMLQETTPMNVHSSSVLLMEQMVLVVLWSTPMTTTVMASMMTSTRVLERPCSKQSMPTAALIHSSMMIRMVSQMQTMFVQKQALVLR